MTVEGNYRRVGSEKKIVLIELFENDLSADAATVSNLIYQMIDDGQIQIILDCHQVKRISSSGLGVLVGVLKRLNARNGQLVLLRLFPHILDIFIETHLTGLFPMFENEEDAILSLEKGWPL